MRQARDGSTACEECGSKECCYTLAEVFGSMCQNGFTDHDNDPTTPCAACADFRYSSRDYGPHRECGYVLGQHVTRDPDRGPCGACLECEAGKEASRELQATHCVACEAGKYSRYGMKQCLDCQLGEYSAGAASNCTAVPALDGKYIYIYMYMVNTVVYPVYYTPALCIILFRL